MSTPASALTNRPTWKLYLELTKPKVVALIVFTAIVGTLLASPGIPPLDALLWGNLGSHSLQDVLRRSTTSSIKKSTSRWRVRRSVHSQPVR